MQQELFLAHYFPFTRFYYFHGGACIISCVNESVAAKE